MRSFVAESTRPRVVFGLGSRHSLRVELERLGCARAGVLGSPEQAALLEELHTALGDRGAGVYAGVRMHVPRESVDDAAAFAKDAGLDGLIAIGGGSSIGLAKALALEHGLPILAVPTTYAGSEMTPIFGTTDRAGKRTGRDVRVVPRVVLYDPELTCSLPRRLTATSGLNAIAHAVEGLYAPGVDPVTSWSAEEGIRALARGLPRACAEPDDRDARSDCSYGAWLCGGVLGATSMGLHHKLCHTLGGRFDLPHSEVHSIVLPHAAAYNYADARSAMRRVEHALGVDDAPLALFGLARSLGSPLALEAIGMKREDLAVAAELATRDAYANPRAVTASAVLELLERAHTGAPPVAHRSG